MSIIQQKYDRGETELNKLKYKPLMGSGHPGRPPLIQKRVPNERRDASIISGTGLSKRLDDLGRITQLFARKEGLNLIANNMLLKGAVENSKLSRQTSSLSAAIGSVGNAVSNIRNATSSGITPVDFLASTLAQVGVSGTGVHFVQGFERNVPKYLEVNKISRAIARDTRQTIKYNGVPKTVTVPSRDSISSLRVYSNTESKPDDGESDLIKFFFEILKPTNLKENEPAETSILYFKAYLDSLSDSYAGNWNSYNYVGRGEQFHTYSSFSRDLSFGFKVAATAHSDLLPIYEKLNFLASTTAPSYSGSGLVRGTFVKLTIGDYINRLPGFISSVSLDWQQSYPWEIGKQGQNTHKQPYEDKQLPTVLDVKVNFTPVHKFAPETNFGTNTDSKFQTKKYYISTKPDEEV